MKKLLAVLLVLVAIGQYSYPQDALVFDRYHKPAELLSVVRNIQKAHPNNCRIHDIGTSFSGTKVSLIEIGPDVKSEDKTHPAVFIAANFEGTRPLASEGALYLVGEILKDQKRYENLTWYILPVGNPEGAMHFFNPVKELNGRNTRPFNDDMDDQIDEDGFEDLNGDGLITQMRVKDPSAFLLPDTADARKMRKADPSKGERGLYKIYSEGIDDDGDGRYNEDGKGGTNNGVSFPHLFKYHGLTSGLWSGQEDEVYGVLKFMTDHPEIAMVMYYGSSNFCLIPPKGGRKGGTTTRSLRVPRRYASMIGADPGQTYSMSAVIEMMKTAMPPGMTVDESTVAGMLGLGPAVNPLPDDLKFYKSFTEKYKKYLKQKGFTGKRLDPTPAQDGSFELWAYYHLGLPVFTQDFYAIPLIEGKGQKDEGKRDGKGEKDEGKNKAQGSRLKAQGAGLKAQGAGLKAQDAPSTSGTQGTSSTPSTSGTQGTSSTSRASRKKVDREAAFLRYSDSLLGGKGFVEWKAFDHPQLGRVEIGGMVPYTDIVPPENEMDSLLGVQVPWVFELVKEIPKLVIETSKIKPVGENIYQLEVWIRNTGGLPYPTAMGKRNSTPKRAIVKLDGEKLEFLSGKQRTVLFGLDANNNTKIKWLLRAPKSKEIRLSVEAANAYGDASTIKLGGK